MNTQTHYSEACQYIPGGVNSPVRAFKGLGIDPVFIDRGEGKFLYDTNNKQYLDFCGSWGALILGHAHPHVISEVEKTVRKGTTFGAPTVLETEMAKLVCTCMPSIEKVRFVSSGTEAVMTAVRLARAFTGKEKIVKFDGCYHGHSDSLLVSAGSGVAELAHADSLGVTQATISGTYSLPYNNVAVLESLLQKQHAAIGAIVMEPVPANMGLILPLPGYLQTIRELTKKYGILLIFDEVITGFRVGLQGAQGLYNVMPDLTCLGKIVGGGFPAAAVGGRRDIMDQLAPLGSVYQAGTLSGNPVAMTAGIATLSYLIHHADVYQKMSETVSQFADAWHEHSKLTLNALGSMFTVFATEKPVINFANARTQDFDLFKKQFLKLLDLGVYTPPSMYETSFISILHDAQDLDRLFL